MRSLGAPELRPWVQLATRIPKALHRDLKVYCVKTEMSGMEFVVTAIQEKLARETGARRRKRAPSK